MLRADLGGDLVVDLARQQAQRQANHPGGMRQHALNREMRLAGIGGTQNGRHTGAAGNHIALRI
jgi:hypothetical protein